MQIKKIVAALAISLSTLGAQATVLTFDDVPGGSIQYGIGNMPTYNGFNFSSTLNWIDLVQSSWSYGAHSGDFALLNNYGGVGIIKAADSSDFSFDGLWAKKWSTSPASGGAPSLFGTVEGWNNGSLVWSVATSLNGSYQFIGAQAGKIDELRLGLGTFFLVDDIALNQPATNNVPEPGSLALAALGLISVGMVRRRKSK